MVTINSNSRYKIVSATLPITDYPRGAAPVRMPKADATEIGSEEIG